MQNYQSYQNINLNWKYLKHDTYIQSTESKQDLKINIS